MSTSIIKVDGYPVTVDKEGYISLTDMAKASNDEKVLLNWMTMKKTIEFLGVWEEMYNNNFKRAEFSTFKNPLKKSRISVSTWVEETCAIGIYVKQGKQGGTYAHKDIAFEFGMYISPKFKLYLIKEYQELKEQALRSMDGEWTTRRVMSKMALHVLTDAVMKHLMPVASDGGKKFVYSNELDLLNRAVFGLKASTWRNNYPELANKYNMRDFSSINQLTCLTIVEGLNAELIKQGVEFKERYEIIKKAVEEHLRVMDGQDPEKSFRRVASGEFKPYFKPAKGLPLFPAAE